MSLSRRRARTTWAEAPLFTSVLVVDRAENPRFQALRVNHHAIETRDHPDYVGREILYTHVQPDLTSQAEAEQVCRKLFSRGARAKWHRQGEVR